ncbi:Leucine--tRNA ligase [Labeo rohita]|uniref:Leucine--tRNA ligase n=1 Tax=Labeo rohita TaxID=84645 RepID=A0ABQ8L7H3_LABRO|nr:Leucine--tRNA ligase [Labeo rohita]
MGALPWCHLTIKMALLLALTSLKRVGKLQALSVARSYLDFVPGMAKAFLYPCPGYVPKVPSLATWPVVLQAFCPPPFRDQDQQKLNCMRALDMYIHRAAMWRKADQLCVCFGPPKKGLPAFKQTTSRWIVDAISLAYESLGLPSPLGTCEPLLALLSFALAHTRQGLGGVGISFPNVFSTQLKFLKGNISGYVCNHGSLRDRDAAFRAILLASLRALASALKLNAGSGAHAFKWITEAKLLTFSVKIRFICKQAAKSC